MTSDTSTGATLLGEAFARIGVDTVFFLMGGPMIDAAKACVDNGIRMIDVRHEQAAAMMAHGYARLKSVPGVCMACSGPGAINLTTGLATALIDCVPVVAIGGSSPISQYETGAFQEIDQLALMRPVTKWAARVHDPKRIPEYVKMAFQQAMSGKPGPVYLDLPGDVLHRSTEAPADYPALMQVSKPMADQHAIEATVDLLASAQRPIILSGSGTFWSGAESQVQELVESCGIPFYTTPQGRGVVPEDHPYFFGNARSTAFKEADLVIVLGTRLNFVFGFGKPPRFATDAKFVRIDIDPDEIGSSRLEVGMVADLKAALLQLNAAVKAGGIGIDNFKGWREHLAEIENSKRGKSEASLNNDQSPIHPLRLCKEIRDAIPRNSIVVVDGQEILNYARQAIPTYVPRHRMNSGTFGTMGVGLPFGLGAKAASPDQPVIVIHGDGSFGMNGLELDTAVRHGLPVLVVISLNGGWTGDPDRKKVGRDLGYTRFHEIARSLGCHGELVEDVADIRPALQRGLEAVEKGQCALVNVVTDWRARAQTVSFAGYTT